MSFGSNVSPKRRLNEQAKDAWECPECKRLNQPFIVVCLTTGCREVRPKP